MKQQLRQQVIAWRNSLGKEDRAARSEAIVARVLTLPAWQQAGVIMCYVSFGSEVATHSLIAAALAGGKRVTVPLCIREGRRLVASEVLAFPGDLQPGTLGILEPKPENLRPVAPELIDLVIVPGVAFDRAGNRLGYGAGYYDRFLASLRPGTPTVALAFAGQVVPGVYPEAHDRPVDMVITEEEIIKPARV